MFCGLRKNLMIDGNVTSKDRENARTNLYLPFHLTLTFRDFRDRAVEQQPRTMFLVVTAQPVHSAYKGIVILWIAIKSFGDRLGGRGDERKK